MSKVIVIGAGIAGLTTALRLREFGHDVTVVTKGIGGLQLSQGTIDVLGYVGEKEKLANPFAGFARLDADHPYRVIGEDATRAGLTWLQKKLGPDYLQGDGQRNFMLPTAVGAIRPTALAQPSMVAGDLDFSKKYVIMGLRRLKDFYPLLVAGNLARVQSKDGKKLEVRSVTVDFEARTGEADTSALNFARAIEDDGKLRRFAAIVKNHVREGEIIGLPAILGVNGSGIHAKLEDLVGTPIFEIPLPPPSVPGMRLNQQLTQLLKDARATFMLGCDAIGASCKNGKITALTVHKAGGPVNLEADYFVLAAGGFESGALEMDSYRKISERIFNLPLAGTDNDPLISGNYWEDQDHLFKIGTKVDQDMRPLDGGGEVVYQNLFAVGGILAGAIRWADKSGEGIALGSMIRATNAINDAK
ncbi:MAG: glycerol-3-phosphate dehydrogenase subunit GlpB [Actinomycetaceae bacterium]|nr:glycerol-3-phosphate dehydrogenase subunit GlpB [Actinomycetaceae bacterium]